MIPNVFLFLYLLAATAFAQSSSSSAPASTSITSIAPIGSPPPNCNENFRGNFEISTVNPPSKKAKRQSTTLSIALTNGVLTDGTGKTGYIASNHQFQFDDSVADGAIYTAGWSVCQNMSLALGPSTVFYLCTVGAFQNIYDTPQQGDGCTETDLQLVTPPGASSSSTASAAATGSSSASAPSASPSPGTNATPDQTDSGNSSSDSSSGLSTGAKAGIGVGVGLGIPLLIALAYLVYRRSKHEKKESDLPQQQEYQPEVAELHNEYRPYEVEGTKMVTELDGMQQQHPVEMEAPYKNS